MSSIFYQIEKIFKNKVINHEIDDLCFLLHGKGDIFISQEKETFTTLRKMLDQQGEIAYWLKKFLYYFNYSPLVRYAMMSYFSEFLLTRMEIIEADIKNNRK